MVPEFEKDFEFIKNDMPEENIAQTHKRTYKKDICSLVRKAASSFMILKLTYSKLDKLTKLT